MANYYGYRPVGFNQLSREPNHPPINRTPRYKSPIDHRLDPAVLFPLSSGSDKSFYGPVPAGEIESLSLNPFTDAFDHDQLEQTNALDFVIDNPKKYFSNGKISLAQTIAPLVVTVGRVQTNDSISIGSCVLISNDLVLLARHIIEETEIEDLQVGFGPSRPYPVTCIAVVEEDAELDYAILKLSAPVGNFLPPVSLNIGEDPLSPMALLHYPLDKPLQISVQSHVNAEFDSRYLETFHDTHYISSGGGYFDTQGRLTAIHLGSELDGDRIHIRRYALPLREIVAKNPHSLLLRGASSCFTTFLNAAQHRFSIDEEGIQSQKILAQKLGTAANNYGIKHVKNGIEFSKENLAYIYKYYTNPFLKMIKECLGICNFHGVTRNYSVRGYIESDHTIPYSVWKSAKKNLKMKACFDQAVGGGRLGENGLPAITIEYAKHRGLLTTGSSDPAKNFRAKLIKSCNLGNVDEALIECFKEYKRLKINLAPSVIIQSIKLHIKLKVIHPNEEQGIKNALGI